MATHQIKARKLKLSVHLFLFQLWIIALVIPAEITDRVLIYWMVTSASAVQILQDQIVNSVSASHILVVLECKNRSFIALVFSKQSPKMRQKVKCYWCECPRCKRFSHSSFRCNFVFPINPPSTYETESPYWP